MSRDTWEQMRRMKGREMELQIAFQCAPLLTGLKESNLLSIGKHNWQQMQQMLIGSGLSAYPLGIAGKRLTVLLYDRNRLERYFEQADVQELLRENGYSDVRLSFVLPQFCRRYRQYLRDKKEFPHEMGLLLGYPPEDVAGFIQNNGQNCLCAGYWKVYARPQEKQRLFARYERARETLVQLLYSGMRMEELLSLCHNKEVYELMSCSYAS